MKENWRHFGFVDAMSLRPRFVRKRRPGKEILDRIKNTSPEEIIEHCQKTIKLLWLYIDHKAPKKNKLKKPRSIVIAPPIPEREKEEPIILYPKTGEKMSHSEAINYLDVKQRGFNDKELALLRDVITHLRVQLYDSFEAKREFHLFLQQIVPQHQKSECCKRKSVLFERTRTNNSNVSLGIFEEMNEFFSSVWDEIYDKYCRPLEYWSGGGLVRVESSPILGSDFFRLLATNGYLIPALMTKKLTVDDFFSLNDNARETLHYYMSGVDDPDEDYNVMKAILDDELSVSTFTQLTSAQHNLIRYQEVLSLLHRKLFEWNFIPTFSDQDCENFLTLLREICKKLPKGGFHNEEWLSPAHVKVLKSNPLAFITLGTTLSLECFLSLKEEAIEKYLEQLIQSNKNNVNHTLYFFTPSNKPSASLGSGSALVPKGDFS